MVNNRNILKFNCEKFNGNKDMKSKGINILRKTIAVMLIVVSLVLLNFIHVAYLPFLGKYLFSFIAFTYLVAIWKIVTRERLWKILSLLIPMVVFLWLASRGDNFSKVPFYYFDIIGILITIGYIVLTYIVYKKSNNTIGRDFATSVNATKTNTASEIERDSGEDKIRLWDYITYLDDETGKQKQGRVIEISPEGEICVEARDEELNYPYPKYVSHENIIEEYDPQEQIEKDKRKN